MLMTTMLNKSNSLQNKLNSKIFLAFGIINYFIIPLKKKLKFNFNLLTKITKIFNFFGGHIPVFKINNQTIPIKRNIFEIYRPFKASIRLPTHFICSIGKYNIYIYRLDYILHLLKILRLCFKIGFLRLKILLNRFKVNVFVKIIAKSDKLTWLKYFLEKILKKYIFKKKLKHPPWVTIRNN